MHMIRITLLCCVGFQVMGCSGDIDGPGQIIMPSSVALTDTIDVEVEGAESGASLLWWWSVDDQAIHDGTVKADGNAWLFTIQAADSVFDAGTAGEAPWAGVLLVQQQVGEQYSGITRGEEIEVYEEVRSDDPVESDTGSD